MSTQRYQSRRPGGAAVELDRLAEFMILEAPNSEGLDEAFVADWWAQNGERITEEWIARHPGSRPWPWWCWDHGKERPVINPDHDPACDFAVRRDSFFGFVHSGVFSVQRGADGKLSHSPWQEPEADYLDRRGLLTETEREHFDL